MSLGDLLIKLRMDTADLESDSGKAAHIVERDMESMIVKATAAGQLIGDALGKMAVKFGELISSTINLGEAFDKAQQRTGFTVQRLSELKFAGDLAEVSFGQITTSLGFFNKALAEAENGSSKVGQTFAALGVDITAGPQAAFEQFIKSVNLLPDQEQKVAAMRIAFGRAGDAMLPMIGNLDEVTARAQKLGIVMSEDLARDSARFNDAMKTMAATSQALWLPTLTKDAAAVATITENLVAATQQGEKWKQILIEIAKVSAATAGAMNIPGGDAVAQMTFQLDQQRRNAWEPARGASGDKSATAAPNPDAVACALSGGKWINGQCVRARTGGGRSKDMTAENERAAREQVAGEQAAARESAEAWDYWGKIQLANHQDMTDAWKLQWKQVFDEEDARQQRAVDQGAAYMAALEKDTKKANDAGREIGLTFTSALGNLIRTGGTAGDAIKALGADFGQLITKLLILDPLAKSLEATFKGMNLTSGGDTGGGILGAIGKALGFGSKGASVDGGGPSGGADLGFDGPGYASGTDYVPRTGLALLHQGEAVIPAAQNRSAASQPVNINFQINSLDPRSAASVIVANRGVITGIIESSYNRAGRRSGMAG